MPQQSTCNGHVTPVMKIRISKTVAQRVGLHKDAATRAVTCCGFVSVCCCAGYAATSARRICTGSRLGVSLTRTAAGYVPFASPVLYYTTFMPITFDVGAVRAVVLCWLQVYVVRVEYTPLLQGHLPGTSTVVFIVLL
jgi:hypothetical protein